MDAKPTVPPVIITVVADNPETIEGLRVYFRGVGVLAHATRMLGELQLSGSVALVLFPDDFDAAQVEERIALVRASHPRLLILFVTSTPQRFASSLGPDGCSLLPIVLPKPVFGWTILDAIRARSELS